MKLEKILIMTSAIIAMSLFSTSQAYATLIQIGVGDFSGSETVLDFEGFTPNVDVISNQFSAGLGVIFNDIPVEYHSNYGSNFATAVSTFAGANGLFQGIKPLGEEIIFTTAVTRIGFNIGSNVNINVPFDVFSGGFLTGSFNLIATTDTMPFFGFEDVDGIDKIVFGIEINSGFVSQIDNLRFEEVASVPTPAAVWLFGFGLVGLIGMRRKSSKLSGKYA